MSQSMSDMAALLCHGCVAVLKELHKLLKESSGRKKLVDRSLGRLCQIDNFVSYTFSPPKMIKACNYIVETHKQELTENLIEYYKKFKTAENLPLQEKFCDHVIKACEGTRRPTKDSEMKPHGLSMDEANEQLQKASHSGFSSIESPVQESHSMQIEKPHLQEQTSPLPHEEL
ncbi:saposin B-type domain-containing protein [Trichonephila inaurata madagascariensis]|uniref:Saposin B-type domain-containing protein n=1 Tax=Trichonephila inaurata madagascariensis TaxID=2747483 RepID=A0A8X6M9W3_9ARAC|nr:saposin B-type domain-containing protein [Trichonephila inaurata madagascariensis]